MRKLVTFVIVLLALAGGAYWYFVLNKPDDKPQIMKLTVSRGAVIDQVSSTGTLQANRTVQIGAQVSGVVEKLHVDFNSIVKKGMVLAEIDPTILQSNVEIASANLEKAKVDLQRMVVQQEQNELDLKRNQDLAAKNLVTQQALEQAVLTVKTQKASIDSAQKGLVQMEANVTQAKTNLGYATVTSPIDGVVVQRNADEGQTVNASTSSPNLFLLAEDLTTMKLEAGVDEAEIGKIHPGQDVTFTVDAYGLTPFHGTVRSVRLNATTQQSVVTYSVVIDVLNPDLKLRPSMTATLKIEIERSENVLRVPNAALRFKPTNDIYAALKQTPPTQNAGRGRGGAGASGGTGQADGPFSPVAGSTTPVTQMAQAATGAGQGANANPPAQGASGGRGNRQPGQGGGNNRQGGAQGASGRGFGQGQNFGRGGGVTAQMTPEQVQKYQSLQGAERSAYLASLGIAMPTGGGRGGGGRGNARPANETQGPMTPIVDRGADAIDMLFQAMPRAQGRGQVWTVVGTPDKPELKAVSVRTGITDGQFTELQGEDVQEGQEVVINIVIPNAAPKPGQQQQNNNPLMPGRGQTPARGGGGGGGRGGN